jgi:hypothetical protein
MGAGRGHLKLFCPRMSAGCGHLKLFC